MVVGCIAGTGVVTLAFASGRLGAYLLLVAAYHMLEFLTTYTYQHTIVTAYLFLLYGSVGSGPYLLLQMASIWEFFLIRSRWRVWPALEHTTITGILLAASGLCIRHRAMRVCGAGFSHYIATRPEKSHVLVTGDIYAYCRHPSYLGFWLFATGLQLCLGAPVSLMLTVVILTRFFRVRVRYEEWHLVHRMFGQQYVDYASHVRTWIPFV